MNFSDKAKGILEGIKAMFNAAPVTPVTPVTPVAMATKSYTTSDGKQLTIEQAGETPAVGELVTIDGQPAPAADYVLEDGSVICVDATGAVSYCGPVEGKPGAAPAAPTEDMGWKEKCEALEGRVALLEAELEKLRQPSTQMNDVQTKLSAHDEKMKGIVDFFNEIIQKPTSEPATRTNNRRTKFLTDKEKAEARLANIADVLKEIKHT